MRDRDQIGGSGSAGFIEPLRPPEAILFDLDGVLADVSRSYRQCVIATAASYDLAISTDDVARVKAAGNANNDWEVTWRMLTERGVETTIEEVTTRFEEIYQGNGVRRGLRHTETLLCEIEWLARLRERLPLGIVTGRPRRDAERFLDEHGIAASFQAVVCMEDGPIKPDPAPVRIAMEILNVENVWFVGDTPDDMQAARRAGQQPLGIVAPGDRDQTVIPSLLEAGAAHVLRRVEEIEQLLP
jgi:HAD superfamily hydrolase (TIGR01548 family)